MMQARIDPAQAMTERVHAAQAFLKSHSALHRSTHHVEPRFAVLAISRGTFYVRPTPC